MLFESPVTFLLQLHFDSRYLEKVKAEIFLRSISGWLQQEEGWPEVGAFRKSPYLPADT